MWEAEPESQHLHHLVLIERRPKHSPCQSANSLSLFKVTEVILWIPSPFSALQGTRVEGKEAALSIPGLTECISLNYLPASGAGLSATKAL